MAKVALFLSHLQGGGAERVLVTLANQFAACGHAVDFILAQRQGVYLKELSPQVNLVDLGARRMALALMPLTRYLRQQHPAGILSSLPYPNMVSILAARLARFEGSVVVREANTPSYRTREASLLKDRLLEPLIVRYGYRYADWVVAVSRGVLHDLQHRARLPAGRLALIYNPAYTRRVLELREQPVEHPWFAPDQPPVVLSVGRLDPQKDFETLLKAFAQVRSQRAVRLMVLGEGPLRPQLESLAQQLGIADSVSLPGFVENPFAYMRRAALFVLSSRFEGFPNVLVQALACGCPVVSTDCLSGPAEILDGGRYGHLVPVGDADALARAMLRVLDGDAPRAPEEWLMQFDEERVAQQYLKLLLNQP